MKIGRPVERLLQSPRGEMMLARTRVGSVGVVGSGKFLDGF